MKKRVGDVEEFAFEPLTDEPDVHVTIAVTGWLTEDEPGMSLVNSKLYVCSSYLTVTDQPNGQIIIAVII